MWVERTILNGPRVVKKLIRCILVHSEPGEDKIIFANDVASWILARINVADNRMLEQSEPKGKL